MKNTIIKTKTITYKDLTGQKFGKLTVLKLDHIQIRTRYWLCECDCTMHNKKVVKEVYLINGNTRSCGCLRNKSNKPFMTSDAILTEENRKLYDVWKNTYHRCYNKENKKYIEYGAKGIIICKEWKEFNTFCNWCFTNGYKDGLALIRKDVNGNYEPNNCVWDYKANYRKIEKEYEESVKLMPKENANSLSILYNDIIPIYGDNNERIINARELHGFLGSKRQFTDWIKDRLNKYNFIENEDYTHVSQKYETSTGATIRQDYYLKMDTAKEIAMVENNEQGRYIRKYFIQIEKEFKNQNEQQPTNSIDVLENIVNTFKQQQTQINTLSNDYSNLNNDYTSLKQDHEELKNKINNMVRAIS